jgi:hypothetical protein
MGAWATVVLDDQKRLPHHLVTDKKILLLSKPGNWHWGWCDWQLGTNPRSISVSMGRG